MSVHAGAASGRATRAHAIGEEASVSGFALAGAAVHVAADAAAVVSAWERLDDDVGLVVLTPRAAAALGRRLRSASALVCVLPEGAA